MSTPKPSPADMPRNTGQWRNEPVNFVGVTRKPTNQHGTTQARRRLRTHESEDNKNGDTGQLR